MKQYRLDVANQVYVSLAFIYEHKKEYDPLAANKFADGCLDDIKTLSYFPHRGFNLSDKYKAKIYKEHLIVYQIQEPNKVNVLDIIDPRQHTVASKYY